MEAATAFLDSYGLAAIFALMLAKAIGVSVPVPADLIMLLTAARVAEGRLSLGLVAGAIADRPRRLPAPALAPNG